MTSKDNAQYVTVEMFNDGMAAVNQRLDKIDQTLTEMRSEIRAIDRRTEINTVKIDELHYFMGIGFTVIAIVVGIVGFVLTLAPMFREMYRDRKQDILDTVRGEMQSMIDTAVSRALDAKKQ